MDNLVDALTRARQADPAAIEMLIAEYGSVIQSECDKFDLSAGEMSTSDLYQEALVRIWTQLPGFIGCEHQPTCHYMFTKWLRKTTRHVVTNVMERRRAIRRTPPKSLPTVGRSDVSEREAFARDPTPSRIVGDADQSIQIQQAIAQLEPAEKKVIELCFFEDYSLRQAAKIIGITYDQALNRFARALNRLRFRLQ